MVWPRGINGNQCYPTFNAMMSAMLWYQVRCGQMLESDSLDFAPKERRPRDIFV